MSQKRDPEQPSPDLHTATVEHLQERARWVGDVVKDCREAGDFSSGVKWFIELRRVQDELLHRAWARKVAAITDPLERARESRDLALAGGSHVAARDWAKRVEQLEAEAAAEAARAEEEAADGLTPDSALAAVDERLAAMPPHVQRMLALRCLRRCPSALPQSRP